MSNPKSKNDIIKAIKAFRDGTGPWGDVLRAAGIDEETPTEATNSA